MAIPESQLETWSHQGSITQSSQTYQAIRKVLGAGTAPYSGKQYRIFLQGSYGNDTNIWAESDVDIVICIDSVFYSDKSNLSPAELEAFGKAYEDGAYQAGDFRRDVLAVLSEAFGSDCVPGGKAIAIKAGGGRRKADVVAASQFRRYWSFAGDGVERYSQGICFWTSGGVRIVNYPEIHSKKMTARHGQSREWLKPLVRVFKNMRSKCIDKGLIADGVAPSYFIEGMLHNVPVSKIGGTFTDSVVNSVNWLHADAKVDDLLCANGEYYLVRDGDHNCWPRANFAAYLSAVIKLWREW